MFKTKQVNVGDYIEIIDNSSSDFGGKFYVVKNDDPIFWYGKEPNKNILEQELKIGFFYEYFFKIIGRWTPNRQFLADFLKLNKIKKTLVSQYLGYSQNWLTQMANDKRRDMTDATLQSIMKKLHIDWTQDTFIHVKATKEHTAYRTRPCGYKHDKHKEILQRAMWDGLFVKA